jgi:PhzF family phenazine biosynthesis protein
MRIWVVDAFTDRVFTGHPAAVVPLERWLPDVTLQAIASENRLSHTAFVTPTGLKGNYQLRWFTPQTESPMSGHATLAAGAIVLAELDPELELVVFDTQAGALVVRKTKDGFTLDLPRRVRTPWQPPAELAKALGGPANGARIVDAFTGEFANVVLDSEESVRALRPDFAAIAKLVRGPRQGCLAVTAPADEGKAYDFVLRFFAPGLGANEDPVTGMSFADLAPYWSDRFDLDSVVGYQASRRGGYVRAIQTLSSVRLLGQVAVYLRGELDASIGRMHNQALVEPDPIPRAPRQMGQLPAGMAAPLAPIFENPAIAPTAGQPEPQTEARRVVVVKERTGRTRRLDDEALVKIVREADLGDAETIHVYEIDDPAEANAMDDVVQVEDTAGKPVKVVIVGRADDVTGVRGVPG